MPAPPIARAECWFQLSPSAFLLTLSLSLNIFFVSSWLWASFSREEAPAAHPQSMLKEQASDLSFLLQDSVPAYGWTRTAAEAAEAAALFNCSGNGDLYIDTLPSTTPACECYECFTGPHCSDAVENCTADVNSGDPLLFAPFWKQNAEQSAVLIPGWYRIGYGLIEASGYVPITPALEQEIRTLHTLVGNAVVENKYIILGVGSMQLLNAAVASLSPDNGTASVVSAVPYYGAYRDQTLLFETSHYTWAGDANIYTQEECGINGSAIEFVTSPNNPDCVIRHAVLNGTNVFTIYDHAYYWPHFTAITGAVDHDVMLFTLSKISGHAGSRLGWAIVKDYTVYTRLLEYVETDVIIISHETQLRATQVLRVINRAYSDQLHSNEKVPLSLPPAYYASKGLSFHYAYAVLRYRWAKLSQILEASERLALQQLESDYCNFFEEVTGPSPGYAWVYCKQDSDEDCQALLKQAGIVSRGGGIFGSSTRFTRLSLLKRDSVFENLADHLSLMVSQEVDDTPSYSEATV